MAFFIRQPFRLALKIVFSVSSLWFTSWLFEGISLQGWNSAVIAVLALLFINLLIMPFVRLIVLPVNFLSFGLLTFVINALLFKLASVLTVGFYVEGIGAAVGGALLYSFFSKVINAVF